MNNHVRFIAIRDAMTLKGYEQRRSDTAVNFAKRRFGGTDRKHTFVSNDLPENVSYSLLEGVNTTDWHINVILSHNQIVTNNTPTNLSGQ